MFYCMDCDCCNGGAEWFTAVDENFTHLEKQTKTDPLVVLVDFLLLVIVHCSYTWAPRKVHAGIRFLFVGGDGKSRMNPAKSVENIFGDLFGVDAIYGVPDILASGDDEGERDQDGHCYGIMQTKHWRIDVNAADFQKRLQASEDIQHFGLETRTRSAGDRGFLFDFLLIMLNGSTT